MFLIPAWCYSTPLMDLYCFVEGVKKTLPVSASLSVAGKFGSAISISAFGKLSSLGTTSISFSEAVITSTSSISF